MMFGPLINLATELAKHPAAGAFAIVLSICAIGVGYVWGSDNFATRESVAESITALKQDITNAENRIVRELDKKIIKRDIATREEQLRQYTQQIELGICPNNDCRWPMAEKAVIERQIETLREQLK